MMNPRLFRSWLDAMIDLKRPLAMLSMLLPWATIEAAVAPKLARQVLLAKCKCGADLLSACDASSVAAPARPVARVCPSG
jgi:hypothetical protein